MQKLKLAIIGSILLIILTGCGISLASDITPPPNIQSQPQVTQQPQSNISTGINLSPPDVENGKLIYQQKCTDCHGPSGMGDGAQAAQLPNPVTAIGDFELSRNSIPNEWFDIVTNGNIEKFMPGFSSLTEKEKWDVIAYVMTLPLTQAEGESGKKLFESTCVICHSSGNNNGYPDFKSFATTSNLSITNIENIISNGLGEDMPGFSNQFDQSEIQALAWYTRILGFVNVFNKETVTQSQPTAEVSENSQVESTQVFDKFTIEGNLINFTEIPESQIVTLSAYENMDVIFQEEAPVSSDGSYKFENLENIDGRVYQLSIEINGVQFLSDILHNPQIDENGTVNLPILLRSTTSDTSGLYVERMHIFFDFLNEETLQIVELFVINNPTDKVIVPISNDQPSLTYRLPQGAVNLQFEQGTMGDRYVQLSDGFGDLQPIEANGTSQFIFAYEIPYKNKLDLSIDIPFPVNSAIFMLPSNSVKLNSDQLIFDGEQSVQGMVIQTYSADNLVQGSKVQVNLSGKIKSSSQLTQSSTTSLVIGSAVFLLTIVFAVIWFRSRSKKSAGEFIEEEDDLDSLLDALIALDDAHSRGDIPSSAYEERRNELILKIREIQESDNKK